MARSHTWHLKRCSLIQESHCVQCHYTDKFTQVYLPDQQDQFEGTLKRFKNHILATWEPFTRVCYQQCWVPCQTEQYQIITVYIKSQSVIAARSTCPPDLQLSSGRNSHASLSTEYMHIHHVGLYDSACVFLPKLSLENRASLKRQSNCLWLQGWIRVRRILLWLVTRVHVGKFTGRYTTGAVMSTHPLIVHINPCKQAKSQTPPPLMYIT